MADPLTQALMRNRQMYDPARQQELINALGRRQATGDVVSALSGGRLGAGMQSGPTPEQMQMQMDQEARQAGYQSYMMERQERADAESARRFDITSGIEASKLVQARVKAEDAKIDKQVTDLSKRMQKTEKVWKAATQLQRLFDRMDDVPGVGFVEGGPGAIGKTVRFFQGDDAQTNYATFRGLINQVLSNQAGSAQTRNEIENILQRYGATGLEDEDVIRAALPEIMAEFQSERDSIRAGYPGVVNEIYDMRFGVEDLPAQDAAPTAGKYKIISVE